jgi:hypothetical protein
MAILNLLQQLLTTKATAVLAAFALVGGGAALAAPGVGDEPAGEEPPESTDLELDEVSLEGLEEQQLQQMADTCAEAPDAGYCSGDSIDEVMDSVDPTDEGDTGLGPEDVEVEDEDEGTRSETAVRVHRALTGSDDIVPGDPEFGSTVSERARSGQPGDLGRLVSNAARGEVADAEDLVLEERAPRTSKQRDDDGPEASGRPAQAGPPAGTPAADRGKGRGGR